MDSGDARETLNRAIRSQLDPALDQLSVELNQLRAEVEVLRVASGFGVSDREERRQVITQLRGKGFSNRMIAMAVNASRDTVAADLKRSNVERPALIVGRDGRTTKGPRPAA